MRRTRIVVTLGPASENESTIRGLLGAGVDVFRLSFAHGDTASGIERLRRVRQLAPEAALMVDIPGPKIRAGTFGSVPVALDAGTRLELVEGFHQTSTKDRIYVERDGVLAALRAGDIINVGDGGVSLEVESVGDPVKMVVTAGGAVMGKPGLSLPSSLFSERLPTAEDRERLAALSEESFEILAVSFVRSAADIVSTRSVLGRDDVMMMAKIETSESVADLSEIVEVSNAIMVARGDLGVRLPIEDVPHLQKRIIREGIRFARPVVVATQMLESMTHARIPTRAEVTDVANAVLDGASAVMLSAETAIGSDPVGVVQTMCRIVERAEHSFPHQKWGNELGVQGVVGTQTEAARITAAITGAAWRAAMEEGAAAIVACTRSGMTARAISRFRPPMPIVAITPRDQTARQLRTSWGIDEIVRSPSTDINELTDVALEHLKRSGMASEGDVVVIMAGSHYGGANTTDTVRIVVVP